LPAERPEGLAEIVSVTGVEIDPDGDTLNQFTPFDDPCEVIVTDVAVVAVAVTVCDTVEPLSWAGSVTADALRVSGPPPELLLPVTTRTIGIVSGKLPPLTEIDAV